MWERSLWEKALADQIKDPVRGKGLRKRVERGIMAMKGAICMAKKKGRNRKRNPIPKRQRHLAAQLKKRGIKAKTISAPPGTLKMSEVIIEFLEPYQEYATTYEAQRKLTTVGLIAWNASLLSEDKARAMIDNIIKAQPRAVREEMVGVIEGLMERKKKHFAEYMRPVIDYHLADDGDEWHLSIASLETIHKDGT